MFFRFVVAISASNVGAPREVLVAENNNTSLFIIISSLFHSWGIELVELLHPFQLLLIIPHKLRSFRVFYLQALQAKMQ